jgi:hypothetical protein
MASPIQTIPVACIRSPWYDDLLRDWHPEPEFIEFLRRQLDRGAYLPPLLVVDEAGRYSIVNGHHRFYAHLVSGRPDVRCIVLEGGFADTEPLRRAEVLLKEFDQRTDYRYQFSGYLDRWAAAADGQNFINRFRPTLMYRLHRRLSRLRQKWFDRTRSQR